MSALRAKAAAGASSREAANKMEEKVVKKADEAGTAANKASDAKKEGENKVDAAATAAGAKA